ncbi:MAG: beta-ketoacyl-ACP synthase [Candidatus Anaerobiospirillum merdipullorum]|uniref:Beta-ketoacyl-ACP synthase n=1 Tax=Candidatus Anaerobiospirillum merdipullorum TaxID=2838450 RepID=A0A9E2KPA3_9GAMM|nr:beta-ketoacyl-ACP synthase [Candidatus Anaerobiospirillum merdipullorum]
MRRVAVTGMGGVCAFGQSWEEIRPQILAQHNAVCYMPSWEQFNGLHTKVAAPVLNFTTPAHYTRKQTRSMGRVGVMSVRATELALMQAGLLEEKELLRSGRMGVAYGSSAGSPDAIADFACLMKEHDTGDINATTYVRMMPHTTAVNVAIFFGLTGRIIPTSSACTSGSMAIGYAYEAIKHGYQDVMVAGGAEELDASDAAVFDVLFATTQCNDHPELTPRPFDKTRDGLVIGEGAATLILEEWEHAKARGATIYAEVVGFGTNCDATHITQPNSTTMQICMEQALASANLPPAAISYISAHGTATDRGDIAESQATARIFGPQVPISSLKSYFGHTLGACGSLEAWLGIEMMREGWFNATINLTEVDEQCGELDYIMGTPRKLEATYIQSNNFAFGGVNTSLIFKRV